MLGAIIRQERDRRGVSQEKLAERVGVSRQAVSKWEQGNAVPTAENLERIERALELSPGTLTAQADSSSAENGAMQGKKCSWNWLIIAAIAASMVFAFYAGRFTVRGGLPAAGAAGGDINMTLSTEMGSWDGAQITLPMGEDGTVQLDMPLSHPGEETKLAMRIGLYQWPEMLVLDKERLIDFDLNPPLGEQDRFLTGDWELVSQVSMGGDAVLGLARTVEEYDGPTLWLMGRGSAAEPWTVLERINEDSLFCEKLSRGGELWAFPAGNVLGYDGLLVRYGDSALVLSLIGGEPRVALRFFDLEGFADLDMDGELEAVCRPPEAGYEIYDREPGGYCRYTFAQDIGALERPESLYFVFDEKQRAFGFANLQSTKTWLLREAPVYDRLSAGGLWRRDKPWDDRSQTGLLDGTAAVLGHPRPDEVTGWGLDGTPLPTPRQSGAAMLRELEAITGYRPQRCYLSGDSGTQNASMDQDADYRTFCSMSFSIPTYWDTPELYDYRYSIGSITLAWRDEWTQWSPLKREDVVLPSGWGGYTEGDKALWWYERAVYFNHGPLVSVEAAQYVDTIKLNLENGDFLEMALDENGFLKSIYGPYEKGLIH